MEMEGTWNTRFKSFLGWIALSMVWRVSFAFQTQLLAKPGFLSAHGFVLKVQKTEARGLLMSSRKADKYSMPVAQPEFSWHHSMIRVKDPAVSLSFYQDFFGMKPVGQPQQNSDGSSSYFLASPQATGEEHFEKSVWNFPGTCIELRHEKDVPKDSSFRYANGNVEPYRGFGHIAFFTDDVYADCETLVKKGVQFQKKPNDGRMKGLAFALDPDGYWIEIITRSEGTALKGCTLAQTMLRVKDPRKSMEFYRNILGMDLLMQKDFSDFSLYFLQSGTAPKIASDPQNPDAASEAMRGSPLPILELTHNHGTENDPDFSYHNGNTEPKGFGHLGFLVEDINAVSKFLQSADYEFEVHGKPKSICVHDPDNYPVQIFEKI